MATRKNGGSARREWHKSLSYLLFLETLLFDGCLIAARQRPGDWP
jgi:hypothetical protein